MDQKKPGITAVHMSRITAHPKPQANAFQFPGIVLNKTKKLKRKDTLQTPITMRPDPPSNTIASDLAFPPPLDKQSPASPFLAPSHNAAASATTHDLHGRRRRRLVEAPEAALFRALP